MFLPPDHRETVAWPRQVSGYATLRRRRMPAQPVGLQALYGGDCGHPSLNRKDTPWGRGPTFQAASRWGCAGPPGCPPAWGLAAPSSTS
jgi:hypothetical protein